MNEELKVADLATIEFSIDRTLCQYMDIGNKD